MSSCPCICEAVLREILCELNDPTFAVWCQVTRKRTASLPAFYYLYYYYYYFWGV